MERKTGRVQGARKSENTGIGAGASRISERGSEHLRLVGEAASRYGAASRYEAASRYGAAAPAGGQRSPGKHVPERRRRRRVTARFYKMVVGAALVFVVFSYAVAFLRIIQVERQIAAARKQIEAAQKRNDQLRQELQALSSDKFVEEMARDELGLVKPGETAWVIVTPEDPNNPYKVEKRPTTGAAPGMEGW